MMNENPQELVMGVATQYWTSRCLHVIAELGVADQLGDEPASAQRLAQQVNVQPEALFRVLRLLAGFGIFQARDGGFAHTPASRLLRSDHPQSQRAMVRMLGMPIHWAAYGELEHAVRTGEPAMRKVAGGTFEYLARDPVASRLFNEAMTGKSLATIQAVLDAYDFSGFARIADIGGGNGHLLRGILAAAPRATGVLFDLPHVIEGVPRSARIKLQAGSFFKDALPECDAYLLMTVLHDWGDADAIRILQAVRRAAPAGARVLVLEMLLPDAPGPHPAKSLDIEMLVMTDGGRERTRAEFESLFKGAGLKLARVVPTATATMIIEGVVG